MGSRRQDTGLGFAGKGCRHLHAFEPTPHPKFFPTSRPSSLLRGLWSHSAQKLQSVLTQKAFQSQKGSAHQEILADSQPSIKESLMRIFCGKGHPRARNLMCFDPLWSQGLYSMPAPGRGSSSLTPGYSLAITSSGGQYIVSFAGFSFVESPQRGSLRLPMTRTERSQLVPVMVLFVLLYLHF